MHDKSKKEQKETKRCTSKLQIVSALIKKVKEKVQRHSKKGDQIPTEHTKTITWKIRTATSFDLLHLLCGHRFENNKDRDDSVSIKFDDIKLQLLKLR